MKRSNVIELTVLLGLVSIAIFFRAYLNNSGIEQRVFVRHDEMHYVEEVIRYHQGDWSPHYFLNPTFFAILLYTVSVLIGGVMVLFGSHASFADYTREVTSSPYLITMIGRCLSLCLSVGAILLLYLIGKRLFTRRVALVAAMALAVDMTHARQAAITGNHSCMVFLVLLFFLCLLGYRENATAFRHAACGFLLGLAVATKYNAAIMIVPLAFASVICARQQLGDGDGILHYIKAKYSAGYVCVLIGFLAGFPLVVAHFDGFMEGLEALTRFRQEGWTTSAASTGRAWTHFLAYFRRMDGIAFSVLCGMGILAAAYRAFARRDIRCAILLAAIVPLCLFLGAGRVTGDRYLLPVIPFVCLLGAWALDGSLNLVLGRWWARQPAAALKWRQTVGTLLLGLAILTPHALATRHNMELRYGRVDSRKELAVWAEANLDPRETYWELSHPRFLSPFYDASRLGRVYPPRSWWLPNLIQKSDSLEALAQNIRRSRKTSILIVMTSVHFKNLRDLPRRMRTPGVKNCKYWMEVVRALSALTPAREFEASDGLIRVVLYDLSK